MKLVTQLIISEYVEGNIVICISYSTASAHLYPLPINYFQTIIEFRLLNMCHIYPPDTSPFSVKFHTLHLLLVSLEYKARWHWYPEIRVIIEEYGLAVDHSF